MSVYNNARSRHQGNPPLVVVPAEFGTPLVGRVQGGLATVAIVTGPRMLVTSDPWASGGGEVWVRMKIVDIIACMHTMYMYMHTCVCIY